jgi:hypothetical protein
MYLYDDLLKWKKKPLAWEPAFIEASSGQSVEDNGFCLHAGASEVTESSITGVSE